MKIGLGTVEFGKVYGVNAYKTPTLAHVKAILRRALSAGIRYLDTAPDYGASEKIVGRSLPSPHPFRIVTKTSFINKKKVTVADVQKVEQIFLQSLRSLRSPGVYGLLVHYAADLLAPGGDLLYAKMLSFQKKGLVKKIGISVYSKEEATKALKKFKLDILQVPINVVDQRLLQGGWLTKLKRQGLELHARSIFLQGALLTPPDRLSRPLHRIKAPLIKYQARLARHGLSALDGAIQFVSQLKELKTVLVGVHSLAELDQILRSSRRKISGKIKWGDFKLKDTQTIDPRTWGR